MDQQEVMERNEEVTEVTAAQETAVTETSAPAEAPEAAEATETSKEPETMQELLDQYGTVRIHKGQILTGTVVSKHDAGWLINVGFKCEGLLPVREYTNHSLIETGPEPKPGDTIEVEVTSVRDGEEAQLTLSRWRHELDKRWADVEAALAEGDTVQVRGVSRVKGGLMVEFCGLEGFIPVSQLTMSPKGANPSNFVGQNIKVKVLDHNKRTHRLVFSRRVLLEQAEAERKAKFYERVHEGDVLEGKVSSVTDFGVFVNLGELDGLVHSTEISWKRSMKGAPKKVDSFKEGDKVTVKVIAIERDKDRISLSMKQVAGDPWNTVAERIHKGDVIKGTVTNLTDFGAFVEIEDGIEGLVHVGDISWTRIKKPRDVLKRGQELEVLVLDVQTGEDPKDRRISLGCKQLHDPWSDANTRYPAGADVQVKVVRLAPFGVFVEVEEGVEALIHISQLSRKHVDKPEDVVHEGDVVTARVLEVNPEQRRMRLSLSALEPEPEPEPVQPKEEKPERRDTPKGERSERPERPERGEGRGRKGKRSKPQKDSNSYEEDEAMYNPFAEAFKGANWDNE